MYDVSNSKHDPEDMIHHTVRNDECRFHLSSEDIRCEHYQHFVGDPFKTPKTFQDGLFRKITLPGLTHPNINCGWLQFGELKRRFIKPIGK